MKSRNLSFSTCRKIYVARKVARKVFNYSILFFLLLISGTSFLDFLQGS
jgi:hypothetical protein